MKTRDVRIFFTQLSANMLGEHDALAAWERLKFAPRDCQTTDWSSSLGEYHTHGERVGNFSLAYFNNAIRPLKLCSQRLLCRSPHFTQTFPLGNFLKHLKERHGERDAFNLNSHSHHLAYQPRLERQRAM